METTEKIIECYVRYVLRWATIPNIKCDGQYEIDLIAIDPVNLERYHIESSVSASKGFSRLTAKIFDPNDLKVRVKIPAAAALSATFEIANSLRRASYPDCVSTALPTATIRRSL